MRASHLQNLANATNTLLQLQFSRQCIIWLSKILLMYCLPSKTLISHLRHAAIQPTRQTYQ